MSEQIDLEEIFNDGLINEYFYNKLLKSTNFASLPDDLKKSYLEDVFHMSNLGVDSLDDEKRFFIVNFCVEDILKELLNKTPNSAFNSLISNYVFENRKNVPFDSCLDLFQAVSGALQAMNIPFEKKAYPQNFGYNFIFPEFNINKWMEATRDIYLKAKNIDFNDAFDLVTKDWEKMEKNNFTRWLKMYQQKVPFKYKTAQSRFYQSPNSDFFVPNPLSFDDLKSSLPKKEVDNNYVEVKPESDVNDARTRIEEQRSRIISRLNSAEKLLASMEGQFFAGDDQEFMLKLLQDLKRKVQTANKITIKSSLFIDYIYRTGNYLKSINKNNEGNFFFKVAQVSENDLLGDLDVDGDTENSENKGEDLSSDNFDLGNEEKPESPSKDEEETLKVLKEFFEGLKTGISGDPDDTAEERKKLKKANNDFEILVEAQDAPIGEANFQPPRPRTNPTLQDKKDLIPIDNTPPAQENLGQMKAEEPERESIKPEEAPEDKTDDVIEAALRNISVSDIVKRLEMLVAIYNQREISRQLNILDVMMDRLGLASYFPSLGEAMQKSLEANQYIATRLGDILTKIKASVESPAAQEWTNVQREPSPETEAVQNNLQKQQDEEESIKIKRKEKEKDRLNEPKKEVGDDLGGAIPVQQPTQAPVR